MTGVNAMIGMMMLSTCQIMFARAAVRSIIITAYPAGGYFRLGDTNALTQLGRADFPEGTCGQSEY